MAPISSFGPEPHSASFVDCRQCVEGLQKQQRVLKDVLLSSAQPILPLFHQQYIYFPIVVSLVTFLRSYCQYFRIHIHAASQPCSLAASLTLTLSICLGPIHPLITLPGNHGQCPSTLRSTRPNAKEVFTVSNRLATGSCDVGVMAPVWGDLWGVPRELESGGDANRGGNSTCTQCLLRRRKAFRHILDRQSV